VDRLRALRNSPAQLHDFAIEVLADEGNPEIAKVALQSLGESIQPADAPVLRSLYNHFDTDGPKRDPGGDVRVEVLRALWPLRSAADRELAMHARNTFERTLQSTGEMIRAAGLALLGVLDPARGAQEAVLVLGKDDLDPLRASSAMTGEPALTAVRLLSSLGETNVLLLYALSGRAPTTEVTGEALRGLSSLGSEVLAPLLSNLISSRDDGLLVAACDVLVELPWSPDAASLLDRLLDAPDRGEVYEFIVSAIVASRRTEMISRMLEALPREMSQRRLTAALEALRLAPPTSDVTSMVSELEARLARQKPAAR
jgi:hypothetical protein